MKETSNTTLLSTGGGNNNKVKEAPQNSTFCSFVVIITLQSSMVPIGFTFGAINPTMKIMFTYCNETYMNRYNEAIPENTMSTVIALMVSAIFAGGFIGALTLGLYSNMFSRKGSMILLNSINIVGVALVSLVGYFAQSYEAIIIGRFLMGFVSGGGMSMVPIITAETSQKLRVSAYLSFIGVFLSASGLVGLILGYSQILGTETLWPLLMGLAVIPSLAYIIMSPKLPQTPYYLLRNGDKTGAFYLLQLLRHNSDESIKQEIGAMERELKFVHQSYSATPISEMLRDRGNLKQLIAVVVVFVESQLCGINSVGMYTDQIFIKGGVPEDKVTYASTLVYSVQLLVALVGSFAVKKWGPRKVNIVWSLVMSGTMTLLVICISFNSAPAMATLSIIAVTVYVLAWASGPNITLFPLVTALTTDTTREACFKIGGGVFWILSWLVSFITPYLLRSWPQYSFLPYCIFNALFAIYYIFYIPETHMKSSDEIQKKLRKSSCPKSNKFKADPALNSTEV